MTYLKNLFNEFNKEQQFIIKYVLPVFFIIGVALVYTAIVNNYSFTL